MKLKARFEKHVLTFKKPAGTSRGVLLDKPSWFLYLTSEEGYEGVGECSIIPGLSVDPLDLIEPKLEEVCQSFEQGLALPDCSLFPAISFAVETALLMLNSQKKGCCFENDFYSAKSGIPINGLIWMGPMAEIAVQMQQKVEAGFRCIKLKVGAIDFEEEIELIGRLRILHPEITIRVDANGAFKSVEEALEKMDRLNALEVHSIEQPIMAGQLDLMADICKNSSLPVALDEELIGVQRLASKAALLQKIKPAYLIFKPSLLGGFKACEEWIDLAKKEGVKWWTTSALESNIGLAAIAQWTCEIKAEGFQGLGTGGLFTNNIESQLTIIDGHLWSKNPVS